MSPLVLLVLLLPSAFTSPLVYGTEVSPHHRPLILRPLLVPLAKPLEEEDDEVDEEDMDPEYRHAVPALYEASPQYRFTAPYATYYERPPEVRRADPVDDLEQEMRQEEEWWNEENGAFLRNLILAQRYREDEEGLRREDKAVRELESLAGKRSPKGQKEVALPASPPRTPSRHTEERSVYAALEKLLQESSQRHRHQKRFVSNEESMLEQLKQQKRA